MHKFNARHRETQGETVLGRRLQLADEDAQVKQLIVQQLAPDLMELLLSHTLRTFVESNEEEVTLMIWILLSQMVNSVDATQTFLGGIAGVEALAGYYTGYRSTLFAADANAMTEDRGREERANAQREERGSAGLGLPSFWCCCWGVSDEIHTLKRRRSP